ncbi:MFS transporter [Streptomyces sp. NPDC048751]|uniref:MFS transporter n=1 Tax=Streptomyces sp. NPDC048751 TaxID=3365591 RepID=UPI00371DDD28
MNRALTLTSSVAGAVIVALDGTVLVIAQPTLRHDLDASLTQVQWTSTGYLIAVAGLLVFAGRLGDRYGHHLTFGVGMVGFGLASAGIGFAPGVGWVIALRIAQGVFGALSQPATLGMLRAAYPPERLRRPLALRTAGIGVAAAVGPVVGGALVTGFGWRAVFFLTVPPALVLGVLALTVRNPPRACRLDQAGCKSRCLAADPSGGWCVQLQGGGGRQRGALATDDNAADVRASPRDAGLIQTTGPRPARSGAPGLDLPGALLLALCLACLVHTLVALPASGRLPAGGLGLAVAVVAGAVLVRHERRTVSPLVPSDVVGVPAVSAALGVLVAASAALNGTLFACVHILQGELGLDAFRSALVSVPLAVLMVVAAMGCPVLLRRAGVRRTTVGATVVLALGVLVLSRAADTLTLCAGFALLGAGFGTVMVAATHVVVRRAPVASAGVAGGLQQTAMNVGPVLGVAVAALLMGLGTARSPMLVLAAVALVGAVAGCALPGRAVAMITDQDDAEDRSGVPARR